MLRLPYENYIRFLITSGCDYEDTLHTLKELELEPCPNEYWDRQFEILDGTTLPKKIKKCWEDGTKRKPQNFHKYMYQIGLGELWAHKVTPDRAVASAMDMVEDPEIRIVTDALLMRKAEAEEISAVLLAKFSMSVRAKDVHIYQSYFFNAKIMSRKAWRTYINANEGFRKKILYLAFTGKEIDMRSELGLPNKISVSEHYQQLHIQALEKFKSLLDSNSPKSEAMALKWAQLAMSAGDKYEKLKLGDASDFGKDLQMEFEYIDTDFPAMGEDDLEQIASAIETGEAKENHEPIPLTANPIKQL